MAIVRETKTGPCAAASPGDSCEEGLGWGCVLGEAGSTDS